MELTVDYYNLHERALLPCNSTPSLTNDPGDEIGAKPPFFVLLPSPGTVVVCVGGGQRCSIQLKEARSPRARGAGEAGKNSLINERVCKC